MSQTETFDAVVLAGGAAERLGGARKPDVELDGQRLVHRVLVSVADAAQIVVVGDVEVPAGVRRTAEEPALGGPVAGLAAGLDALGAELEALGGTAADALAGQGAGAGPAPWTAVLACDLADPVPAVGRLLAAWSWAQRADDVETEDYDGWCLADSSGQPQWLIGIHRTPALRRALDRLETVRDASMRELFADSVLVTVPGSDADVADIDTWTDHAHWVEQLQRQEPS